MSRFPRLLKRLFFVINKPKALFFLILALLDFRCRENKDKRSLSNTVSPLQKIIEVELSKNKANGEVLFSNDLSHFNPISRLYNEWKGLLLLYDSGVLNLLRYYVYTFYYIEKSSRLGSLYGKFKVAEFYALFLSISRSYSNVGNSSSSNFPAILLVGCEGIILDGAHRLALARFLDYNIPVVVFDRLSSRNNLPEDLHFVLNDLLDIICESAGLET